MCDVDNFIEKFRFMFGYLRDTDYELSEKLQKFVLDGEGKPEILIECAIKISFNRAYCSSALSLIKAYENYMLEKEGYYYPFLTYAAKETICRNMVSVESNSSNKSLYLLKMNNGTIKIGIATDVKRRISQIKAASGMDVEYYLFTSIFKNAKDKENELHKRHKNTRKNGEFFSCNFSEVEKEILDIAKAEGIELYYSTNYQKKNLQK